MWKIRGVEFATVPNGESFNQVEEIIDKLNEAFYHAVINKKDGEKFIEKAASHLFRGNSSAIKKAIALAHLYLEMKLG